MSEYEFATFYVVIKQEQIKQDLQIKILYIESVIKIVAEFISKNKKCIQKKYKTQYDSLDDENFYSDVINILKQAKQNGVPLEIKMP